MKHQEDRAMHDNEPWAKLMREIGLEPYHTEAQARRVARHAADKLDLCHKKIAELKAELCLAGPISDMARNFPQERKPS